MRRRGAAAVSCAAVLAAVGCAEDGQFIDDYNEAMKPLQDVQQTIAETEPEAPDAGQRYRRLADKSKKVNDDLADLSAPDDARADFDRLKAALRRREQTFRELAREATDADGIAAFTDAQEAIARDSLRIDKAQNALKRKVED